ncbi:unnamed protein product [Fraxinus pennsylvanica]|uniref:non-specific serine/threonine protein kinase n=1 Tax=Fraxinus pennsylvanica TaxID=56036 RepID=A0AAD2AAK9_9LAMI|nr:unnamed protein product [Fraxinus pennsylvanica]
MGLTSWCSDLCILRRQSLGGKVPPKLFRLPYLIEIDLTRNYLNGTIPREWGTMQRLETVYDILHLPQCFLSLLGNRVTGGLPIELANISTLLNLTLDYNQLSGNIPPQFGNFSSLEKLSLISNNLSGELPQSLVKLTTMTDFGISDNFFSGNIPNFIQSWTNLRRLFIQGSGLSGPIPSGIASMANLSDLRISDLNGDETTFPHLSNNSNIKYIILRSCNIIGQLPKDFGKTSGLKVLDLSFNSLVGSIPNNFSSLSEVDYIYLTGNSLTGPLPTWMLNDGQHMNLFASGIVSCLRSFSCIHTYNSLHINCGGEEVKDDDKGTLYKKDKASGGASNFVQSATNWGFSSTGHFLDNGTSGYLRTNTSSISGKNPQLYMDARVSPLSLSYYGFCLKNGNYTISLHFAEIVFTKDRTYSSLGRRIFAVYIQGQLVLKDFNIEDEAGGVNIGIIKIFSAAVTDNTVDIRVYWAGRGTTGIPYFGEYGPLILAISVNLGKL